jgi:hypothetical protein
MTLSHFPPDSQSVESRIFVIFIFVSEDDHKISIKGPKRKLHREANLQGESSSKLPACILRPPDNEPSVLILIGSSRLIVLKVKNEAF